MNPSDLACTAGATPGQLLVGYNVYGCDTTTQIFGNALITDSKLAPLSECYNGTGMNPNSSS